MPKKTIAIFSTAYHPFIGGAEVAVKEITDRISKYDFILFTAKIKRGLLNVEKIGNIQVYRLGFGFSFDKFFLPILAFIKFFTLYPKPYTPNPILWGMMASYGSIAAYLIKLFKPQIPFLLTLQEGDSEEHLKYGKFGMVGFFGKRIIKKADYIQVISGYLKDFVLRRGAKARISIVPNGVDITKIQNVKLENQNGKENFKEELNIKDDEKVIITTSRLVYKNGIDVLIKAIAELKKINLELKIKLLILGDGVLRKNLEKLVDELSLENNVLFLGLIPQDEIYDYLAISDLFARPSRSEGLGNSFLEAMACGVPVIGTSVGGIPDFLIDNETGVFCEVDDPKNLASKIILLLQDENLRKKIIENGKNLVKSKYDWLSISKQMENIFKQLL